MFIATFAKKNCLAPEERNVYSCVVVKSCLAPEERNVYSCVCQKELPRSSGAKCARRLPHVSLLWSEEESLLIRCSINISSPLGRGSGSEVIDSTAAQSSHDRRTDEVVAAIQAILVNCGSSLFLTIYDLLFAIHGS
jgi:hypothetical protein